MVISGAGGTTLNGEVLDCTTIYIGSPSVPGCTDEIACNYNSEATEDDGSCDYAAEGFDCDGNCILDVDCEGECGGSASEDDCGVCNGNNACSGATLSLGAFDASGLLEVLYDFGGPVAGFQFDVTGLDLTGASGGAAGDAGMTVSTGGATVVGFSLTNNEISAGSGVLTVLAFSDVTAAISDLSLGNFGAVTDVKIASGITSSKLTGALPALNGSALTNVSAGFTKNASPATFTPAIKLPVTINVLKFTYIPSI